MAFGGCTDTICNRYMVAFVAAFTVSRLERSTFLFSFLLRLGTRIDRRTRPAGPGVNRQRYVVRRGCTPTPGVKNSRVSRPDSHGSGKFQHPLRAASPDGFSLKTTKTSSSYIILKTGKRHG